MMADTEETGYLDQQLKFVLVGDEGTGKTSIVMRFCQDQFEKQYKQTLGIDFFLKRISLTGGINVTVQMWDLGGQTLNGQMVDKYIYGAQMIGFVYDVTNQKSFDNIEAWLKVVRRVFGGQEELPYLALLSNKCDLDHMRVVRLEKHFKFAEENGMVPFMVSAKTGEGICDIAQTQQATNQPRRAASRRGFRRINQLATRGLYQQQQVTLCFHKIASDILGVKLTRSEQETVQPVVKAEIVPYPSVAAPRRHSTGAVNGAIRTTVCIIQ